ncbi:MAG: hypothetical protein Q9195_000454 [Heterodermia aff. obscurata]
MALPLPTPTNLMTLPTDLRLQILEYILPLHSTGTKSITFHLYQYRLPFLLNTSKHTYITSPSPRALARYLLGIALVNHQLHSESLRILHTRTFILQFTESAFFNPEADEGQYWSLAHPSQWQWYWGHTHPGDHGDYFPGLDFGAIQELRVAIRPSDAPGFWACLMGSIESLCRALRPRIVAQGLKKLVVEVGEMKESREAQILRLRRQQPVVPGPADVMELVEVLWLYLRGVEKCEVLVPGRLFQDGGELVGAVAEMERAVCGPWTEGDLMAAAADEKIFLAEKPFLYARRSKEPVSWAELTEKDIRTENYFRVWDDIEGFRYFLQSSGETILSTQMTAQDREDHEYASHWHLVDCLQTQPGRLVQGTYPGRLCYYWKNDEKDKWLWQKTSWETEDDFYRVEGS